MRARGSEADTAACGEPGHRVCHLASPAMASATALRRRQMGTLRAAQAEEQTTTPSSGSCS
jgi:hypothetical protein